MLASPCALDPDLQSAAGASRSSLPLSLPCASPGWLASWPPVVLWCLRACASLLAAVSGAGGVLSAFVSVSREDKVAHGIHSLLVPSTCSPFSLPVSLLSAQVCSASSWVDFVQRGRLSRWPGSEELPPAPPERIRLSRVRSSSPAPAPVPPAQSARASSLPTPRGAPASLHPPAARPARQNPCDAEARLRSRDKRRRRPSGPCGVRSSRKPCVVFATRGVLRRYLV